MKVLLYTENEKLVGKSGLGKAIKHQQKALEEIGVPYTLNVKDDYDILHVNTYFPKSYMLVKSAKKHNKKIVYHAHSTEEDYRNGFIFGKQTSALFKKWLMKCYNLGDVFVNASLTETQGLTFIEAMAAGIPVVAKYAPNLSEYIKNGKNGILVKKNAEFKNYILKLFNDEKMANSLVSNGYQTAKEY